MKNVMHLLIGFIFCAISSTSVRAAALTVPVSGEQNSLAVSPECQARSLKMTCYYTDALRLNSAQAAAVKQATLQEMQQLDQLNQRKQAREEGTEPGKPLSFTEAQVLTQYTAAMLRILTPEQYSTFQLLQERQASTGRRLPDQVART